MPGPVKIQHRHAFVKAVAAALRNHCRLAEGARVLVAVSGGADSVALLRALALLAPLKPWQLELSVGHVQHHLRDAAEGDAEFVAALARSLNLPFLRADLSLEKAAGNLENRARRERYAALHTMARAVDASFVAAAHHGDDQLETLLMRLMRGASVRGLRGMRWRSRMPSSTVAGDANTGGGPDLPPLNAPLLIRPMLGLDRAAVTGFLRDIQQDWREDHTNQDVHRCRARLRRDVLPVLRELKPDVAERAAALSDHIQQVGRVLRDAIDTAADRVIVTGSASTFDRTDARTLRRVVLFGLLRKLVIRAGAAPDRTGQQALHPIIRAIRDTTGGRRTFDLSGGVQVTVTRDEVSVIEAARE